MERWRERSYGDASQGGLGRKKRAEGENKTQRVKTRRKEGRFGLCFRRLCQGSLSPLLLFFSSFPLSSSVVLSLPHVEGLSF